MKRLIPVFTSILLFFGGPVSARYYEASTGRFLQEDPIMLPMPVFSNSSPLLFSSQILNLYAYTENNPIDRIDPLGLWYIDVGVAAGLWGGAIGGFLIGPEGIYPYAGGGAMYLPGVSVTWSPSDPTSGWGIGAQGGFWLGGQYGYGFGKNGKGAGKYWEFGFVTPGASLAGYYVDEPWKWPWKKPKSKICP